MRHKLQPKRLFGRLHATVPGCGSIGLAATIPAWCVSTGPWGRRRIGPRAYAARSLLASAFLVLAFAARAQDIEPRAFSNAPLDMNFLIGGYVFTRGGLSFDSAIPITDEHLKTSNAVLAYARVFELWGQSAKFDATLPYTWLSGTATFAGRPVERTVNGFSDGRLRVSVNFYGAPALTLDQFRTYQQDLIIGANFAVTGPTGQYDPSRVINLSTNRWTFRPELGVSKAIGPLTLELSGGPTFYSDNTNFLGGRTRSQDPIYAIQGHTIYAFRSGIWGSVDATYFTGGRTSVNGVGSNDLQQNWRVGVTVSIPLGVHYSVKLYGSSGVSARTRNNYDLLGFVLQYRWGGGL
jgi:hypothetical protein